MCARIPGSSAWWVMAVLAASAGCGFETHAMGSGDAGADGSSDGSMPDTPGSACYGPPGPWRVCLGATPTGLVPLPPKLDTDKSPLCARDQPAGWLGPQPAACFVLGDMITTSQMPTAVTGQRPLVLVAHTSISIVTRLDLAGHEADNNDETLVWPTAPCRTFSQTPGDGAGAGAGGGAGGSFTTRGGNGGRGGSDTSSQNGQAAPLDMALPNQLRAGCPGQVGGGRADGDGGAGRGGGAVYLLAGGAITIAGVINASGAGGSGGARRSGGSGGGSGGMIVLHGASITIGGTMIANGGGGAGGGDQGSDGSDGEDPSVLTPTQPAPGGGNGGQGFPAIDDALDGRGGATQNDGGGGGGGGAGYIRSNRNVPAGKVSPTADIVTDAT